LLLYFTAAAANAVPGADSSFAPEAAADDAGKNIEQLLEEADTLLRTERPIDARAKLQRALALAPTDYRPYMKLGFYYLTEVGHFRLAYRYLKSAEKLFAKDSANSLPSSDRTFDHAMLLHLIAEAELNLDKYEDTLKTLDRFEQFYWMDWYPGTRAWVLMKLKRIDDAIKTAQAGLLRGADPRQTWNILGILLSVKDNRELSLQAFAQSIRSEIVLGGQQIATPLNNAGEVYRELFLDDIAEASWLLALRLPDGCEHILPSLNLSIIYVDQLRLFQAERVLRDFEGCFAQHALREDTEHRTLLALGRGRIALHENDVEKALELLTTASEDQQWFGKIGTNENDVRFAATAGMAQVLLARAAAVRDKAHEHWWKGVLDAPQVPVLKLRSWWLNRTARKIALEELDDFEDLIIRNTDTMIEYPTLGSVLAGFNTRSLRRRISRIMENDSRSGARPYYQLYLAANLADNGAEDEAREILQRLLGEWRAIDRLALAETLAQLIQVRTKQLGFFGASADKLEIQQLKERLFGTLPARLRFYDYALPVKLRTTGNSSQEKAAAAWIAGELLSVRFEEPPANAQYQPAYTLAISCTANPKQPESIAAGLQLIENATNRTVAGHSGTIDKDGKGFAEVVNNFIAKAFAHQSDAPAVPLPRIPILEGLLDQ